MKTKKIILFAGILLSLVISLISGVNRVTLSKAENMETNISSDLKIEYCNLSFNDSVYIKYAVKANGKNTKILIWDEPSDDYSVNTNSDEIVGSYINTIGGEKYYIFDYKKLSAKQMTDVVYARAYYEENGKEYYGEINKYSILQYAYNKLGKTGVATTNEDLKEMLNDMLVYGASAQKHFKYKTDRLPTSEWYEVKLNGGYFEDGFGRGLFTEGTNLTATASETDSEGKGFARWIDEKEKTVCQTKEFNFSVDDRNREYSAVHVKYSDGLEFESNGDGTCVLVGLGNCADTDVVIPKNSSALETVTAIGDNVFKNKTLNSISIPISVTSVGVGAFSGCSLNEVNYDGTAADWDKIDISSGNDILNTISKNYFGIEEETHTVTFIGYNNAVLATITGVAVGESVTAPNAPDVDGYRFIGWDKSFDEISADITVTALYESIDPADNFNYTVTNNIVKITGYKGINPVVCIPDTIDEYPVEEIANNAFKGNVKIKSVIFPNTLKTIGENAFGDCTLLENIILNEGLLTIQKKAFANTSLSEVVIPNSVTLLNSSQNYSPFGGCAKLRRVVLGNGLTEVYGYMFNGLTTLEEIVFGANIVKINSHAFYNCSSIKEINLPAKLQVIAEYAFEKCYSVENIVCPNLLTTIGEGAFYDCTSLENIILNEGLLTIQKRAFANTSLSEVVIPNSVTLLNSLQNYSPFGGCAKLRRVVLGNGLTAVYGYMFNGLTTLEEVVFGANIVKINSHAFYNCSSIREINLPAKLQTIEDAAFQNCTKLAAIVCGDSLTTINSYAFAGCTALTDIVWSDSLTTINNYAFAGCTALTAAELPLSTKTIGEGAFSNCTLLENIILNEGLLTIQTKAFQSCTKLTDIAWGDSLTTINNYAFAGCTALTTVELPSSVKTIGEGAFSDCTSLENIILNEGLLTIQTKAFANTSLSEVVIPNSVTLLNSSKGMSPFAGCTKLRRVVLGNGLTEVCGYMFNELTTLEEVVFGENITSINVCSFYGTSLAKVNLPTKLQTIESNAFQNCIKLTDVAWGDSLTTINNYAFAGCTALTAVELPSSVKTIGEGVFSDCTLLENIILNKGLRTIKILAFANTAIKEIAIPNSVIELNAYYRLLGFGVTDIKSPFSACKNLQKVVVGSGIVELQDAMFYNLTNLREVVLDKNITAIKSYAFANCSSLTRIDIPSQVQTIGNDAFHGCINLYDVNFNGSLITIGNYAFAGTPSLKSVEFPSCLETIGSHAFESSGIENILIPASVMTIGDNAFSSCNGSEYAIIEDGDLQTIGQNVFASSSVERIYYCGTLTKWSKISINSSNTSPLDGLPYIYSETEPTNSGNYWHYNSNGIPIVWNVSLAEYQAQGLANVYGNTVGSSLLSCSSQYLKVMNDDSVFMTNKAIYESAAIMADFSTEYENKISREQLYIIVLLDILGYQNAGVTETSELEKAVSGYSTYVGLYMLKSVKATSEAELKAIMPSKNFLTGWNLMIKILDTTEDYVSARNNLLGFALQCQGSIDVLDSIQNETSNPKELRSAASKCIEIITKAFDGTLEDLIDKDFQKVYLRDLSSVAISTVWDTACGLYLPLKIAQLISKGVKIALNVLCDVGVSVDAYYQLSVTQGIETSLRKQIAALQTDYLRDENKKNSVLVFSVMNLYKSAILKGYEYTVSYLDSVKKDSSEMSKKKAELERSFSQIEAEIDNMYYALYI